MNEIYKEPVRIVENGCRQNSNSKIVDVETVRKQKQVVVKDKS